MKNFNKILWGIVLITIGVMIGLNILGLTDINFFFRGWWTLFIIIIPCLIGLFNDEEEGKTGNLIRSHNWCDAITWGKRNNKL